MPSPCRSIVFNHLICLIKTNSIADGDPGWRGALTTCSLSPPRRAASHRCLPAKKYEQSVSGSEDMGYTVALTGGIGSGKSTVADAFAQLGVKVIDADVIARQVVEPGTPALQAIVGHFGPQMIAPDGTLNRRLLREKIFAHVEEKARLNALLHPLIQQETRRQMQAATSPYLPLGRTFAGRKPPVRPGPIAYWSSMCRKRRKSNAPCCAIRSAANMLNIFLPPRPRASSAWPSRTMLLKTLARRMQWHRMLPACTKSI